MIKKNNAQAAFDNIALLGLVLLVAVAVFYYAGEASNTNAIYLTDTVKNVENTIESLSNLGDGSADTIVIRTPKGVDTAVLSDCGRNEDLCKTMEVTMDTGEVHKFGLSYPVWGSLGFFFVPGTHYVTMVNDGDNQRIVFQECGDGLVSGSEQCEACLQDSDCDNLENLMECYFPNTKGVPGEDRWGYCTVKGTGAGTCGENLCRTSGQDFSCYCECESDLDCPTGTCLPDGVCGGCENNNDCDSGEYCSLGNCLNCDKDKDTYDANYNSACTQNGAYWDCNDNDALINGGATEVCDDLVDNNCDGNIDCDDSACTGNPICDVGSCNDNGVCEVDETCSNCAGDCGGCCPANLLEYWRVEEGSGTITTSDNGVVADFITYPAGVREVEWELYSHSAPMLDQWDIWFNEVSTEDDLLRISSGVNLQSYSSGTLEFIMDGVEGLNSLGRGIFRTCDSRALCNSNGLHAYFDDLGNIDVEIKSGSGKVTVTDNGACKNSNYQCYIAITWEEGQPLKIYVNNGSPDSSVDLIGSNHIAVLDAPYIFGKDNPPSAIGTNSFIGEIHQFAFYEVALSDSEVLANFQTYYFADPLTNPFAGFLCGTGAQCGDNQVEFPEECDDGNLISGDGCDASCKTENVQVCGDGIVVTPEACDDGSHCSDGTVCTDNPADCSLGVDDCQPRTGFGQSCDATCNWEQVCGDGIVVGTEECDEGVNNGLTGICSSTCTYNVLQCDWLNNYWRFEEQVNPALYDANGGKIGGIGTATRAYSPMESESIGFWDVDQTSSLSITEMNGKGTIFFWINPAMASTLGQRVLSHDDLTIDLLDVPGSVTGEKYFDVWFGNNPQNVQSPYSPGYTAIMADGSWTLVGVYWDQNNFYVYYHSYTGGPQTSNVQNNNHPLIIDNSLTLGYDSKTSSDSFLGNIDEFATFSEKLDAWVGGMEFHDQTFLHAEGSSFCGRRVCGDESVNPLNSLGINELCDDELLFGTGGCSKPGTLDSFNDLLDCQFMNGGGGGSGGSGPYCGNGVLESGEVCDPPGGIGPPYTFNCNNVPVTVDGVCKPDCSGYTYADPCDPNPPGPYCGNGDLDIGEQCDPPGSLGAPFFYTCPEHGTSFWVWGVCSSSCNWVYPFMVCGDDEGDPECPEEPAPDPTCTEPYDVCAFIDCEAGVYDLGPSRQCEEPTPNAHWQCDANVIEIKCSADCQCPAVTPNSCSQFCRIVCS